MKTIGSRIKYLRDDILKLSQESFAKKIGITQQSLHLIETGVTKMPREQRINKIIEATQARKIWLLTGDGEPFELVEKINNSKDPHSEIEKEIADIHQEIRHLKAVVTALLEKKNSDVATFA
jgi:transcriptional regulator with XRE-family HTH domain